MTGVNPQYHISCKRDGRLEGCELLAFYIFVNDPGFETFSELVMVSEVVDGIFNLDCGNFKQIEWGKWVACIDDQARFVVYNFSKKLLDDTLIGIPFHVQRILVNKSGRTAPLRSKING